jgi:hypothetical protein
LIPLSGSVSPNMALESGFTLHDRSTSSAFDYTSLRQDILALPEGSITDLQIAGTGTTFLKKKSFIRSILTKDSTIILYNLPWFQFQETIESRGT